MTLLEFAEKTSSVPLTAWQKEFLTMYERARIEGKQFIYSSLPRSGKRMVSDIINSYYNKQPTEIYCQGIKKKGIPCKRYLGKLHSGKVELLCPICKTVNVVEGK